MAQTASMQSAAARQATHASNAQARNTTQAQQPKSLKRPSTEDAADTAAVGQNDRPNAPPSRPSALPPQFKTKPTPQQIASLTPDQRAKYEAMLKFQAQGASPSLQQSSNNEIRNKIYTLSLEAAKQLNQESMPDIPMSQQEYNETALKLQRLAADLNKVSRGINKWWQITRDDNRVRMFCKMVSHNETHPSIPLSLKVG